MKQKTNLYKLVLTALFAAIVVVLQVVSSFVKFGPFSITLTLIPIVVGGMLLGVGHGALFGGLFGLMTFIFCLNGVDPGGAILVGINPFLTCFLCLSKGIAAGIIPALVYRALRKKNFYLGAILGTVLAPIANTGIFLTEGFLFFKDTLISWAGGADLFHVITVLVGINFLVEFLTTVILSPAILRILQIPQKNRSLN
ncbi:MAG: ECF transporter S component [Clostridia bacterium]|nr:ECF transporter S component [Clostridia bacterium]